MNVVFPIGIMVAIIIGISLIPLAAPGIETQAVDDKIVGTLLMIFVTIIVLGAVAWIGFGSGESSREGKESSSETMIIAKTYAREHRKLTLSVIIGTITMLLLWLITFI